MGSRNIQRWSRRKIDNGQPQNLISNLAQQIVYSQKAIEGVLFESIRHSVTKKAAAPKPWAQCFPSSFSMLFLQTENTRSASNSNPFGQGWSENVCGRPMIEQKVGSVSFFGGRMGLDLAKFEESELRKLGRLSVKEYSHIVSSYGYSVLSFR